MKKNLVKIDFSEISELDDKSLHVVIGGTSADGKSLLSELLEWVGIEVNGNCHCSNQCR